MTFNCQFDLTIDYSHHMINSDENRHYEGGLLMAQKNAALACTECGQRNYQMTPTQTGQTTRLELKKFCKYCNKHTPHKETK